MDRRQQKTRTAIFAAFTELLEKKPYSGITIQEIIDGANVGRTTFYAHFETKDELLKTLCEELFGHIINDALDQKHTHGLFPQQEQEVSIFFHMLAHLQENDRNILRLLSGESNEVFIRYFRNGMIRVVENRLLRNRKHHPDIPSDFLINHIAGSFIELIYWWIAEGMRYSPKELDKYFRIAIEQLLRPAI